VPDVVLYALQPFGVILMWFLLGCWVWRNDGDVSYGDSQLGAAHKEKS
jgi:hypothetical protein